jgi:ubiquitin carboxyl-terminal hydrolase 22/27/51
VTTAFDPVMDLSLDLRIKDKKKLLVPGGIVQTVQQCLARFTATEKLGLNEYNCDKCSGPKEATKQLTIKRLPPVLCIQLKVRRIFLRFTRGTNSRLEI